MTGTKTSAPDPGLAFQRSFNLGRVPYVTLALMALLVGLYFSWQGGSLASSAEMVRAGAKSRSLMLELGQWWRLLSANLVHASGWHLIANTLFLLNLGGPAEAVFRRLDYLLVLVSSALGASLVSTLASPVVSCGASGIVFGVWGSIAVFGIRYREVLPERYRRYFTFGVIPYALFVFYLGLVGDGIDNWSHLGGLLSGSAAALFLPARVVAPTDSAAAGKLAALALAALSIAAACYWPLGPGTLSAPDEQGRHGLVVLVPARWSRTLARRAGDHETFAYGNEAGVSIGIDTQRTERPVRLDELVADFVDGELDAQLEEGDAVAAPVPESLAGLPASRVRAELVTEAGVTTHDFILVARGYYRYVVSLSAPSWLAPHYAAAFARVAAAIEQSDPEEVESARVRLREALTDVGSQLKLALALAHAGALGRAMERVRSAERAHPDDGRPAELEAQLLFEHGQEPERACERIDFAIGQLPWSAPRALLAIDVLDACGRSERSAAILAAALARFPDDAALLARRDRGPLP